MGRLERLKIKATKALEKGNDKKFNRIDKKRADMQLPGLTAALQAKSPYMMYGEKSDTMTGGSPLAKTGCSKTYKKGALKAEGTVDIVDSKTGKTTKVTKTEGGGYTKGGKVVTLAETQKVKSESTRTESYAQKIARLKKEKNG